MPMNWRETPEAVFAQPPAQGLDRSVLPDNEAAGYDMHRLIERIVDEESFFAIKPDWATELITGVARLDGHVVGIVANNPQQKGGVLFIDSADKAARFIWLCDAFNIPLIFLADVPGFMIGTQVERQGIIRHGAKMITAITDATVPKLCVVVRKAYGAGLYAMSGPAFDPIATIALPTAKIAVMGPEPAVNAVYANRIAAINDEQERRQFVDDRRREYEADVDLLRLASELVIDAVVDFPELREDMIRRLRVADPVDREKVVKRHGVPPV
jgi:acetyl-CoA carboxylase carboxyltransferase component